MARGGQDGAALPEIIGRLRIRGLIGLGGNAVIYSAWDEDHGREVALKLLRDDRSSRPDTQARFLREAKAMARLDHPNVVMVFDAGLLPAPVVAPDGSHLPEGAPFLVM